MVAPLPRPAPVGYTLASLGALREFPDKGRETRLLYFLQTLNRAYNPDEARLSLPTHSMDGIDLTLQGDATVGGDIVGGDKIVQQHFGHTTEPRPTPRMPQVFVGHDEALRELIAALGCSDTRGHPLIRFAEGHPLPLLTLPASASIL